MFNRFQPRANSGMGRIFGDACQQLLAHAGWDPVQPRVNSLAFSACLPKAGVTTLVLESARVAAAAGQQVLLVDCNPRGTRLNRALGIRAVSGLCEALNDTSVLNKAIRSTKLEGVSALTHGRSKRVAVDNLPAMEEVVDQITSEFDLVLFDMPFVRASHPINAWYRHLDGTIFIVAKEGLKPDQAHAAQAELQRSRANVRGIVLNGVEGAHWGGTHASPGVQ